MGRYPYVHALVNRAKKRGEIVRSLTCQACGNIRATFAHHDDYLKPLEVRWLCKPCHMEWHSLNGPGANAELADLPPARKHNLTEAERKAKREACDERFPEMVRMMSEGATLQSIGNRYGISRERVRQIIGSWKQYRRPTSEVDREDADQKIQGINNLRRAGKTAKEISSILGIKLHVLNKMLNRIEPKEPVHGTLQGWRRGCRCERCKGQGGLYVKKIQNRMREQGRCIVCCKPLVGGKAGKCQPCYEKWYVKYGPTGKPPKSRKKAA